jgi:hypothetical protein
MNRDASNNSDPYRAKSMTALFYFDLIIICKIPSSLPQTPIAILMQLHSAHESFCLQFIKQ